MKSHIKRAFGKCICSLMLVITMLVSMVPVSAQSQGFEITGEMQAYGSAGTTESFVSTEQALEYKTSTQILPQGDIEYYCRTALGKLPNGRGLQYAYDQIVEGVEQGKEVINLTDGTFKISQPEFNIVLEAHRRDYAHHFWLDPYYNIRGTSASNITQFLPQYMFEGDELTEAKALFEQKVQQVLSGITPTMSDFEKELYLHDTLADMVVYVEDTNAHNAYGALVEGRAVCEGYAEALQYLLHRSGIEGYIVIGSSYNPSTNKSEGHAWNAVKIDGQYYHVDLTWNDQDGYTYHSYFNLTDEQIEVDHVIDDAGYPLALCNSEDQFYFNVMGGNYVELDNYTVEDVVERFELKDNVLVGNFYLEEKSSAFLDWFKNNVYIISAMKGYNPQSLFSYSILGGEMMLKLQISGAHTCNTNTFVLIQAKSETCTDDGWIEHYVCVCGANNYYIKSFNTFYIAEENYVMRRASGHKWTEKIQNEAHLKHKATKCTENDEYWYDCSKCDLVSDTSYYKTEINGAHDYKNDWSYGANGHWHACRYCDAADLVDPHTPNIPSATSEQDKYCTVCLYVIENAIVHTHTANEVKRNEATCEKDGNKLYYACGCGAWFEDANATHEITDKNSVVIEKLGHDYTEKKLDKTHIKTEAQDCKSVNVYWFDCSRCTKNAKDDQNASDKYFSSDETGKHNISTAWTSENGQHYHKCTVSGCTHKEDTASCSGGSATCQSKAKCSVCKSEYGNLGKHNISTAWMSENGQHYHKCTVNGCTHKEDTASCLGGSATCQSKAKCSVCKAEYGNLGKHNISTAWTSENGQHYHKCTVSGCTHKEDTANCSGGSATCKSKAKCSVCQSEYGNFAAHDFDTSKWGYTNVDGHANRCKTVGCTEHNTVKAHTPNIPAATENQAKICTACDYMIQSELGHVHSTTRVDDENADCLKDGVKLHYECACGEWFKDASATQKISDKASYIKPATGHSYTERIKDAAHLKLAAQNCQSTSVYWYDCGKCDANAKNDANGSFYDSGDIGAHSVSATWISENGQHYHKCTVSGCTHKEDTANCSGGSATCQSKAKCSVCNSEYGSVGVHNISTVWTSENGQHYHECTVNGCTHKQDTADCSGGSATCQSKAKCSVCSVEYGEIGSHDYDMTAFSYSEADGHAHKCKTNGCSAHDTLAVHVPNIPSATNEQAKVCTECDFLIEEKLPDTEIPPQKTDVEKFKDLIAALDTEYATKQENYRALYDALIMYGDLDEQERQSVSDEYTILMNMVELYNASARSANGELAAATEVAFAPLCVIGFAFLSGLIALIKKFI